MRRRDILKEVMADRFDQFDRFLDHLEQRQAKQHTAKVVKELLLASRAVIDSVIDTLDLEQTQPDSQKTKRTKANKINIES